jgi:hypothetical protein
LNLSLNIISFDIPFPANYGGVMDVFYKLRHLHEKGVKIHLHCFEYGREHAKELELYCEKVYYYKRKTGLQSALSSLPYNVASRTSDELAKNLLANDFPILFEVLHTCCLMSDPRFEKRFKIYRHSNIEHEYYHHLANSEKNIFKKLYLNLEAGKLERFEKTVADANLILAVSRTDLDYFRKKYPKVNAEYLPSFHPNEDITVREGIGSYILYHGNLGISENYEAALWLIRHVFSKMNYAVKIAGLNPPGFLRAQAERHANIELIANPTQEEMTELLENAQIHALFTKQATGLKLKLLNVLYRGRFVICNDKLLNGTGIGSSKTLVIANTSEAFITAIETHFTSPLTPNMMKERRLFLEQFYNQANTEKLISLIKPH